MAVESTGDRTARSPKGAMGLMQIMPKTWNELRARYGLGNDPWQPRANIMAGAAYLREMHDRYGSMAAMLAAYNAGPRRYDAHLANGRALPAETVDYVAKIAPMIDGKVPVMRLAGIASRASWSRGPIFVGRSSRPSRRRFDDFRSSFRPTIERACDRRSVGARAAVRWPLRAKPRSDGEQR
jgi:membrane-bound lytic murein transglycosylase B